MRNRGPGARSGFTLIEVMISIAVLFLGVITAGGVMISVQQSANFSEDRYRDHADLRARIENLKAELGTTPGVPSSYEKFATSTGHLASGSFELNAAGLSNLIRVEMQVEQANGVEPIQFVTYLRADDV